MPMLMDTWRHVATCVQPHRNQIGTMSDLREGAQCPPHVGRRDLCNVAWHKEAGGAAAKASDKAADAQREGLLAHAAEPCAHDQDGVVVEKGMPGAKGVSSSAAEEAADGGAHKQRAGGIWAEGDVWQAPLPRHDGYACVEDAKVVACDLGWSEGA